MVGPQERLGIMVGLGDHIMVLHHRATPCTRHPVPPISMCHPPASNRAQMSGCSR